MIEKFVNKIVNKQLEKDIISKEDANIYKYGYILMCEVLINICIALVIAVVSTEWLLISMFLIIYIPLRSYCGGWHANKLWKCTIYSNLIILVMLIGSKYMLDAVSCMMFLTIFLICSGIIIFTAPIDTTAKPISIDEKKAYRSKIKVIILLHFCAFVWMLLKNEKAIMYVIDFSYITQTIMLFLEMTARRLSNTRIKN